MNDHVRLADEALIKLAERLGEVAGRQQEIKETLDKQWERQMAEDADHAKIKATMREIHEKVDRIPFEVHEDHHAWVKEQINAARARREVCNQIKTVMITRGFPFALLATIAFVMYLIGAKDTANAIIHRIAP